MSGAPTSPSIVQSYEDKLNELIESRKGRSEPLDEDRKAFTDAWVGLVSETGITNKAVDYLFDGFKIAEAEPLYELARRIGKASAYEGFLKTIRASQNKSGCTLCILLNLLALELMSPSAPDALDCIARWLPGMSKTQKKEQFKGLDTKSRKHLIHPLAGKTISPKAEIQSASAKTLQDVLKSPLKKLVEHKCHKGDESAINTLLGWLEEHAQAVPTNAATADDASTSVNALSDESTADVSDRDGATVDSVSQDGDEAKSSSAAPSAESNPESRPDAGITERADSGTDSSVDVPPSQDKNTATATKTTHARKTKTTNGGARGTPRPKKEDLDALKKKLTKAEAAKEDAEDESERLRLELKQTQRELLEQRKQRDAVSANYVDLQHRLDEAESENASLRENLAAAEGMLTMLKERNAHQADVAEQKMIRDLRFEYQDFRDALDLEMDIGLGENMRDQLGNVFDILISNGIDL